MTTFYQAFCFLQSDGRYFHVLFSRFIESRSNYFGPYTAFHIGHLLRALIYQHHHQVTSGWLAAMALATSFSNTVLPVFGCATINPRCPLPIGVNRSIMRVL